MKSRRHILRFGAALALAAASASGGAQAAGVPVAGLMVEGRVLAAIRAASDTTGVAFPYLLAKAYRESGFDAGADAASSSAAGIFQFTRQTWLDLFQRHGARYGQATLAARIARVRGVATVADAAAARRILALRHDPALAAHLAAEYTRENREVLERALGRRTTPEELYIAHFLGPQGALQLLRAARANPDLAAAEVFPDAAASNPALFTPKGELVSVASLHRGLVRTFRRELVRFSGYRPPALSPRKPRTPDAATLAAALAAGVLPGGGFALPWVDPRLDAPEPVRDGLAVAARDDLLRVALAAAEGAPTVYSALHGFAPPGWVETPVAPPAAALPAAAAAPAFATVEAAWIPVAADRAAGLLVQSVSPRFAAAMPEPEREGVTVARGAMPRYEEREAPELADASARRPGV